MRSYLVNVGDNFGPGQYHRYFWIPTCTSHGPFIPARALVPAGSIVQCMAALQQELARTAWTSSCRRTPQRASARRTAAAEAQQAIVTMMLSNTSLGIGNISRIDGTSLLWLPEEGAHVPPGCPQAYRSVTTSGFSTAIWLGSSLTQTFDASSSYTKGGFHHLPIHLLDELVVTVDVRS